MARAPPFAGASPDEDAERVTGRIGVDPERFARVVGAVEQEAAAQGQDPPALDVEGLGVGHGRGQVELLRHSEARAGRRGQLATWCTASRGHQPPPPPNLPPPLPGHHPERPGHRPREANGGRSTRARSPALGLGFAQPAAAAAVEEITAWADVNGDGRPDRVVARRLGEDQQLLRVTVNGRVTQAVTAAEGRLPLPPLRVADFGGDGAQDVLVTEVVGANTVHLSLWGVGPHGLRRLRTPDGAALVLYEGGGISAVSAYTCAVTGGGKELVVVEARLDGWWDPATYSGTHTSYRTANGVATPTAVVSFTSVPSASPLLRVDPALC